MKKKIFTIYDVKAENYLDPIMYTSRGESIRAFGDAVNQSDHFLNKHPEDFTLFYLGEYDTDNASYDLLKSPEALGVAIEFLNETSK